jgi:predicted DNA-binding protein with PD1-like motif
MWPLRLLPGDDLRQALVDLIQSHSVNAAYVLQGIGSRSVAHLRMAGAAQVTVFEGDFEILTLAGSVCPDGAHLHMAFSDADGKVAGGHVAAGCIVRTTAELLLAWLPEHRFSRDPDAATGFAELVIRPAESPG